MDLTGSMSSYCLLRTSSEDRNQIRRVPGFSRSVAVIRRQLISTSALRGIRVGPKKNNHL